MMRIIVVNVILLTIGLVTCSNETLLTTTTLESVVSIDKNVSSSSIPTGNSAIIKDNFANFVQHSNKLLDNHTADSGTARSINSVLHTQSSSSSSSGLSAPVVISIVVVTCLVVIGAIFAALFVMRRRFDIFRLNPVQSKDDVENGSGSDNVDGAVEQVDNVDGKGGEVDKVVSTSGLTSVENKQAVVDVCDSGAVTVNVQQPSESVSAAKEQASPSSASPLIESNEESVKLIASAVNDVVDTPLIKPVEISSNTEQVTSSTSLIANVINEISESVASKLSSKSPAKTSSDPEKQPLNESKE